MTLFASSSFVSFISSIPVWGWFDVGFTAMVLIGVCGESAWAGRLFVREGALDLMPVEPRREKLKKRSEKVLIMGLMGELICLGFSLWDSSRLFKVGEQAKESAAIAKAESEKSKAEHERSEIERLELEKQVVALAEKSKFRSISPSGRSNLVAALRYVQKGHVEILCFDKDGEAISLALSIKRALREAGFEKVDFSPRALIRIVEVYPGIIDHKDDLVFGVRNPSTPPEYANLLLSHLQRDGLVTEYLPEDSQLSQDSLRVFVIPKLQ